MFASRRLPILFGAFAVLLLAGCGELGNGACEGEMNGLYFQLRIENFTDETFETFLNGRPIGEVGPYEGLNGANQTVPGFTELGEFPVCDGHIIDAKGTNNSEVDQRFCSEQPFLACGGSPDFCFEPFIICDQLIDQDQDGIVDCITSNNEIANYSPPFTAPVCPCTVEPGGAWEKC